MSPGAPDEAVQSGLPPGYHSPQFDADVRLNTNEFPEAPPERVYEELRDAIAGIQLNRYPDRMATELRAALAEHHDVPADNVFCANGSNEVLQCLFLSLGGPGKTAALFEPTYALHSHIARLTRTAIIEGERDAEFLIDMDELERLLSGAGSGTEPDLVFLCSPNNPTGRLEPESTVLEVLRRAHGIVVLDEAYAPFAHTSAIPLISEYSNLVVVRTFSKSWSLAGLRLGYAITAGVIVDALFRVALPYHLDALKQRAGVIALENEKAYDGRINQIIAERFRVVSELGTLGVEVVPSDANFILFQLPGHDAPETWRRLAEGSVLVRDVSSWPRLAGYLRVTIGTPRENDAFLVALRGAL
ncbi:MAG: histidinol-phosphate transaminase [Acidimicrobiales bacterium]